MNELKTDIVFKKDILLDSLKCFVTKKKGIFYKFKTDSRISPFSRAHYCRYFEGKCQDNMKSISGILKFWLTSKKQFNWI